MTEPRGQLQYVLDCESGFEDKLQRSGCPAVVIAAVANVRRAVDARQGAAEAVDRLVDRLQTEATVATDNQARKRRLGEQRAVLLELIDIYPEKTDHFIEDFLRDVLDGDDAGGGASPWRYLAPMGAIQGSSESGS